MQLHELAAVIISCTQRLKSQPGCRKHTDVNDAISQSIPSGAFHGLAFHSPFPHRTMAYEDPVPRARGTHPRSCHQPRIDLAAAQHEILAHSPPRDWAPAQPATAATHRCHRHRNCAVLPNTRMACRAVFDTFGRSWPRLIIRPSALSLMHGTETLLCSDHLISDADRRGHGETRSITARMI